MDGAQALSFSDPEIQHLDAELEAHRKIGVAFRNMERQTFADQVHTDKEKKTEGEHFQRRMTLDEVVDYSRKNHHHGDSNNHCNNHYRNLVHHADGGNDPSEAWKKGWSPNLD